MSMEFSFKEGPQVHVSITMNQGTLEKVVLKPDTAFNIHCTEESEEIYEWCRKYSQKKTGISSIALGIDWKGFTSFQAKVLQALAKIPFGKTATYREIASRCGHSKAYRAAGGACGKNPFPLIVPCHRVLASDGTLGGFSQGLEIKERLLAFEDLI